MTATTATKRGRWRRGMLATAAALLVLAGAAALVESWLAARDRAAYPPPGRIVAVDGIDLHLDCRGSGQPTVVIESGLMSGSSSWARVHDPLAADTRVCAWDRPGIDWSGAGPGVDARALAVAARLHALLAAAGESPPWLLVGMSAGGVYVREFHARYPGGVAGMVLVDSSHEQQATRLPQTFDAASFTRLLAACRVLQPFGVVRWSGVLVGQLRTMGLPDDLVDRAAALGNQPGYCAAIAREWQAFDADLAAGKLPRPLGDLPLRVISQGRDPALEPGVDPAAARAQRAAWDVLQAELAALSSRGQRVIATESGHLVQLEQPGIVIATVRELVAGLRADGPRTAAPATPPDGGTPDRAATPDRTDA